LQQKRHKKVRGAFCTLIFSENLPADYYVRCCGSGRLQPELLGQSLVRPRSAAPVFRVLLVVTVVENRALDGDQRITRGFSPKIGSVQFLLEDSTAGCLICGSWYAEAISILLRSDHAMGCFYIFVCGVLVHFDV
jgi:hypothetical protein